MAEKSFSVSLSARVDQYVAAMGAAKKATEDTGSSLTGLEQLGGKLQSVGSSLTTHVSLPIVAVGGLAVKMASDFDQSFSRMVGLAGVTADEVEGLKESVLDLAGETAQAPGELADALYEASSAGLDTEQALGAVKVAAKAAAAGMGSARDIVGLVASATAAYGSENIDAAEATDVLTAAIRAGRADPEELAGSLGRVLPIAAQLGVSFDEVGGATAYLSNVFGDTNRTVTALQGFLVKLVSPSEQGRAALTAMGTSAQELQAAIQQDGLLGALELLREHGFAGNQQALRKLFDDIEGFQGALALLNDNSGTLGQTLNSVKDSTGALDEAFTAASETGAFKMKQAWAEIQAALIQAGQIILPIVAGVAGAIGDLAAKFGDLPAPAQTAIVGLLGVAAALGPMMTVIGGVVANVGSMVSAFKAAGAAIVANPWLAAAAGIAAAIGIVGLAIANHESKSDRAAKRAAEFYKAVQAGLGTLDQQKVALLDAAGAAREFGDAAYQEADKKLREAITGNTQYVAVLQQLGLSLDDVMKVNRGGAAAEEVLAKARERGLAMAREIIGTNKLESTSKQDVAAANAALGASGSNAALSAAKQIAVVDGLITMLSQQAGASYDSAEAAADLVRIGDDQAYTYLKVTGQLGLLTAAEQAAAEAHLDASAAAAAGTSALGERAQAIQANVVATEQVAEVTDEMRDQQEEAAKAAEKLAKDALEELRDHLDQVANRFEVAAQASSNFGSALDAVINPSLDLEEANRALEEGIAKVTETVKKNGDTLDISTEKGRANRAVLQDQVETVLAKAKADVAAGVSVDQVTASTELYRQQLINTAMQAGLSETAAKEYIDQLGLTPENVATAVQLMHDEEVKARLAEMLGQLDGIDAGAAAEIRALIDQGSFDAAEIRLQQLARERTARVSIVAGAAGAVGGSKGDAVGGFYPGGTNQLRTTAETSGSLGNEVVLPLGQQDRMQALLGLPQVYPMVSAAMAGLGGGGGGSTVVNNETTYAPVLNNNGRDVTVDDINRALTMARLAA